MKPSSGGVVKNDEKVLLESSSDVVVKYVALDSRVDDREVGVVKLGTETLAMERGSDVGGSSLACRDREVDVSDVVKVGDELVESKTEMLTMEASCKEGGDVVQDKVDDARVSGNKLGLVIENGEKVMDVSSLDAVVSSVVLDSSVDDREVDVSDRVKIGGELVESKTEMLTMEVSYKGGGDVVQDKVADVAEKNESSSDASVLSVVVSNDENDASNVVKNGGELVGSKTEMLTMEKSMKEGGDVVRDLVADVRVSGDEVGKDSEVVMNESSSDVVVSSVVFSDSIVDPSNAVKTGAELVESKVEMLMMEPSSKKDGDIVVQDLKDDGRGSGNEMSSDAVVSLVPLSNSDIDASNVVKVAKELVETETDTLMMEPSSKESGDTVVQGSTDDVNVSGDEIAVKTDENSGNADEEKEGGYKVTDLVWAKVRNYPWWPGQIFDPSAATDKAKKYSNKKAYLIAYFGDQSFAWNKASNIKPFRINFVKMVKQSNSIPFHHAVNCALDEVYRRVEFGLACSCLSEEVVSKLKSQVFVNSGITKEASRIDGGDGFSTVATFKPVNAVRYLQDLAREDCDGVSKLEALSVKAQLLVYLRWKGYNQFTTEQLEDNSEVHLTEKVEIVEDANPDSVSEKVSSKKRKLKSGESGSGKQQHVSDDYSVPSKKEKVLSNVTLTGSHTKPASESEKVSSTKRKLKSDDSGSQKQQRVSNGDSVPSKKEKILSNMSPAGSPRVFKRKNKSEKNDGKKEKRLKDVTPTGSPSLLKREDRSEKKSGKKEQRLRDVTPTESPSLFKLKNRSDKNSGKKATAEGKDLKETSRNGTADQKAINSTPKKLFIGDKICKIAKQLSESPSNL